MTQPPEERTEELTDGTSPAWPGVGRRPLLKALGVGAALSMGGGVAAADDGDGDGDDDEQGDGGDAPESQAEGFQAEVVVPHATFPDDVGLAAGVTFEDGVEESAFLHDASTVVVVRADFDPGGTSGWHSDQGPALITVVEGEVDVTIADGPVTRTYAAGEATIVTGEHADLLENASDEDPATVYVIFLGVPDGEPPSTPVPPPDC